MAEALELTEVSHWDENVETEVRPLQNEQETLEDCETTSQPDCCVLELCCRLKISADSTAKIRSAVGAVKYLWMINNVLLLIDVFENVLLYRYGCETLQVPIRAFIALVVTPPLTFVFWYRPLLRGFQNDSSLNFVIFRIFFSLHRSIVLVEIIYGVVMAIGLFPKNTMLGVVLTLIATLNAVYAIACFFVYLSVDRYFRTSPTLCSLSARAEFAAVIVQDRRVAEAAASIVADGAPLPARVPCILEDLFLSLCWPSWKLTPVICNICDGLAHTPRSLYEIPERS